MRTLVISDLHLGTPGRADLLRRPELRAPLLRALEGVDRLVLLGDIVELREVPQRDIASEAAPFLRDVGARLGGDGEIVMLSGNHDHGLVAGWIEGRLQSEPSGFLRLEQRIEPRDAGRVAARLAELAAPARVSVAYPGVWLRDDVYAMHGHYADVHTTVPTFDRLAAGAMTRFVVHLPETGATADDYEAVLSPLYAFLHTLTQRSDHQVVSAGAGASARAWAVLAGGGRRRPLRAAALGLGFVSAISLVNAVGLGPVRYDLTGAGLRQGGLHGLGEVVRRLGIDARYVIWGHSHRSGPWPGDDLAEWTAPTGARVINSGSWVYQRIFLTRRPAGSPYWPGTAVIVDDQGPPRLERLLGYRGHADLEPPEAITRPPRRA